MLRTSKDAFRLSTWASYCAHLSVVGCAQYFKAVGALLINREIILMFKPGNH
jgi:hypothetical protein